MGLSRSLSGSGYLFSANFADLSSLIAKEVVNNMVNRINAFKSNIHKSIIINNMHFLNQRKMLHNPEVERSSLSLATKEGSSKFF